jgi:hypothetical protein
MRRIKEETVMLKSLLLVPLFLSSVFAPSIQASEPPKKIVDQIISRDERIQEKGVAQCKNFEGNYDDLIAELLPLASLGEKAPISALVQLGDKGANRLIKIYEDKKSRPYIRKTVATVLKDMVDFKTVSGEVRQKIEGQFAAEPAGDAILRLIGPELTPLDLLRRDVERHALEQRRTMNLFERSTADKVEAWEELFPDFFDWRTTSRFEMDPFRNEAEHRSMEQALRGPTTFRDSSAIKRDVPSARDSLRPTYRVPPQILFEQARQGRPFP